MRAISLSEFGGPEVLRLVDVPEPQGLEGRVLIDVEAAGVNFGDLLVREGAYMGRDALPVIPGWEVVGRRVDAGERVAALLSGGGYAERVSAPLDDVVPIADDVPDAVALAMVIQGATAWHLLETPKTVATGETVIVTGLGSGVTHLVIQLAALRGAEAIVCTSGGGPGVETKSAHALELGAARVIDAPPEELTAALRAACPGGADALIDCIGEPLFTAALKALRPGGRAVVYGVAGGKPASVHTGAMLKHGLTVAGLWLGHGGSEPLAVTVDRLLDLWRDGQLTPTLGPELPLEQAAHAHELVAARTGVGKVTLRVGVS